MRIYVSGQNDVGNIFFSRYAVTRYAVMPLWGLLTTPKSGLVSQRHKFGCAFLSYFSWESRIALYLGVAQIE